MVVIYEDDGPPTIEQLLEWMVPGLYEKYVLQKRMKLQDILCRGRIKRTIKDRMAQTPFELFDAIEIETLNRCNSNCSFCAVNKKLDPRPFKVMDEDLFNSIIAQLTNLQYKGYISLYSNNEPLLDQRIADFCKIAKQKIPSAPLFLFTNGKLLTEELFEKLMKYLDLLVIDNYDNRMKLIEPVKAIYDVCLTNPTCEEKVVISLMKKDQLRSTRGGSAPNRTDIAPLKSLCILPFTQMVVRPDGKISLCDCDALGKVTLGDLTRDSISDVWNGDLYWDVRRRIAEGRKNFFLCRNCDHIVFTATKSFRNFYLGKPRSWLNIFEFMGAREIES